MASIKIEDNHDDARHGKITFIKGLPQKQDCLDIRVADVRQRGWEILAPKVDDEALVLSIRPHDSANREAGHCVRTGNFVGRFKWDKTSIEIEARFPESFLKRMLNVADEVMFDNVDVVPMEKDRKIDTARLIVYYMFVQKLERALLLGLPKAYQTKRHHDLRLRGRVDINRFIRRDIPFRGRISSVSRDLCEDQAIIDVLDRAVRSIERDGKMLTRYLLQAKHHLREQASGKPVTRATLHKARQSKALRNPIYAPYRQVLNLAEVILGLHGMNLSKEGLDAPGFLVDMSWLFESYMRGLLRRHFPDWSVESPELTVYERAFFNRKMIPDIVMRRGKDVMVFDAKYKRMMLRERTRDSMGDVDREDFFQIHTYMTYYSGRGDRVIAGGLLYPMEVAWNEKKCKTHWFGVKKTAFVVDGVVVDSDIGKSEDEFLSRVRHLVDGD